MKKKLISASFHYKNETIFIKEHKNLDLYIKSLEDYYNRFIKEHHKYYKDYINQLDQIIGFSFSLTDNDIQDIFIKNIYVLVRMNKLKQDEYNGTQYCYEYN